MWDIQTLLIGHLLWTDSRHVVCQYRATRYGMDKMEALVGKELTH